MPEDDEDDFMQPMVDDMSDEDMSEDEEVPPKLVKKRKLENGTISQEKPLEEIKKLKKEKEVKQPEAVKKVLDEKSTKAKEESDEESSEEDSSDDDADDSKVSLNLEEACKISGV